MKTKLRKIGNSLGITIPSGELRELGASTGDMLEVEILRVLPTTRSGWDNSEAWSNSRENELLIDIDNEFDETEWEW